MLQALQEAPQVDSALSGIGSQWRKTLGFLLEQGWVMEPKTKVKAALAAALGDDAQIEGYALFKV